jgi:hypothetical protein
MRPVGLVVAWLARTPGYIGMNRWWPQSRWARAVMVVSIYLVVTLTFELVFHMYPRGVH